MTKKSVKAPVQRCCECEKIVSVKGSMVRPYSVEKNKKTIKVTCFDCEVKELVCFG
jgi:hypothetical protein